MSATRIIAAAALLVAGFVCLAIDARSAHARAKRDAWQQHLSIEDYERDPDLADRLLRQSGELHLGGWLAGMVCIVCAAAVVS